MRKIVFAALGGVSLIAFAQQAAAQDQTASGDQRSGETNASVSGGEDIIVTARRKEESLQDVPQTVNVVTGQDLERLQILNVTNLDRVVSGLQINGTNLSLRGVTFNPNTAGSPTVATYINDAPVLAPELLQSVFDVGQVEVLRGPQGTVRGVSSPSGAITLTTRRPDLQSIGGTVYGTLANHDNQNLQGAFNLPIITDKLAVRVGGVIDNTPGTDVRSINSNKDTKSDSKAIRASLRFEPTSTLRANVTYQRLENHSYGYGSAVFGSGSPGGVNPNAPAGYNGPVIDRHDRVAVTSVPAIGRQKVEFGTAQVEWNVLGQQLSFTGSRQQLLNNPRTSTGDLGNLLLGYPLPSTLFRSDDKVRTEEIRLQSDDRILNIFDYTIGYFHSRDRVDTAGNQGPASFLAGAFGAPGTVVRPGAPNRRFEIDTLLTTPRTIWETSFFGTLTAHLGDKLEVSGGVRRIRSHIQRSLTATTTPAFNATAGLSAAACAGLNGQFGATYANVCDIPVAGRVALATSRDTTNKPTIYNFSASYKITPHLLVYANTGSSFRQGIQGIGINNATNSPQLDQYIFLEPEKSKSYEGGVKFDFLDGRGRLNVDYYHQKYKNFFYGGIVSVPYLSFTGAPTPTIANNPFFSNQPVKIDGVDVEGAFDITRNWSVSANYSYNKSKLNGTVPCQDGNFDGVPDGIIPTVAAFQARNLLVATCALSTGASTAPKWNLRGQTSIRLPVSDNYEAFVNALGTYQPKNRNASQTYVVPRYATLDLFAGIRSKEPLIEVQVFAKNITNTRKVLDQSAGFINPPANLRTLFGDTGYRTVTLTQRRQIGVSARYSFGSR